MEVKIAKSSEEIDICYKLRETIFIKEQNVPVNRERDNDDNFAIHFLLFSGRTPVGVGRVVADKDVAIIGRLGILDEYRGKGAGFFLMGHIINYCKKNKFQKIILGAQEHALGFYKKLNFEVYSEKYMDANIPHFKMQLTFNRK